MPIRQGEDGALLAIGAVQARQGGGDHFRGNVMAGREGQEQ